jgi:response regulator RpfG family c-di-GMP phosphodiesterase
MNLGKLLTSCLFTIFSEPSLASRASKDTLMEVERDIMQYLVDDRMLKMEDAAQLLRTFNSLISNICDNGDKTAVFG